MKDDKDRSVEEVIASAIKELSAALDRISLSISNFAEHEWGKPEREPEPEQEGVNWDESKEPGDEIACHAGRIAPPTEAFFTNVVYTEWDLMTKSYEMFISRNCMEFERDEKDRKVTITVKSPVGVVRKYDGSISPEKPQSVFLVAKDITPPVHGDRVLIGPRGKSYSIE